MLITMYVLLFRLILVLGAVFACASKGNASVSCLSLNPHYSMLTNLRQKGWLEKINDWRVLSKGWTACLGKERAFRGVRGAQCAKSLRRWMFYLLSWSFQPRAPPPGDLPSSGSLVAAPPGEIDGGGDIWEYMMCRISVYGQMMLI